MLIKCDLINTGPLIDNRNSNPVLTAGKLRKTGEYVFIWTYPGDIYYRICYKNGKVNKNMG